MSNQLVKFGEKLPELHKEVLVIMNGRKSSYHNTEGKQFTSKMVIEKITPKAGDFICRVIKDNGHISYIPVFPNESWCYMDDIVNWNEPREGNTNEE